MGFGPLLVLNEDRVAGGAGFGAHPHQDMEIISYVLAGALEHKDSMGNGSVVRPGDVQRMSAGTGVLHSEYNHSKDELVHFLQIWIRPAREGIPPEYEQRFFPDIAKRGQLCLVASPDGRDASLRIHQDALMLSGLFDRGEIASYELDQNRRAYVHVVQGNAIVNGEQLRTGDALKIRKQPAVTIEGSDNAEVLVFDLP